VVKNLYGNPPYFPSASPGLALKRLCEPFCPRCPFLLFANSPILVFTQSLLRDLFLVFPWSDETGFINIALPFLRSPPQFFQTEVMTSRSLRLSSAFFLPPQDIFTYDAHANNFPPSSTPSPYFFPPGLGSPRTCRGYLFHPFGRRCNQSDRPRGDFVPPFHQPLNGRPFGRFPG